MPNIKFNYLYRDAGNYKTYGSVVFSNPEGLSLQQVGEIIKRQLIDGTWFYAHQWQLPGLYLYPFNSQLDHSFHEFESVTYTHATAAHQTIAQFIKLIQGIS